MTLYGVILFLHVGAALVLTAGLGIDALILLRLRLAGSPAFARLWLGPWKAVPPMTGGSGAFLLLSGLYLTNRMSAWNLAWPMVALAALILTGALGGITSRRMRALRQACAAKEMAEPECVRRTQDPFLKLSLSLRIALLFGALWLMVVKPGALESLSVLVLAVIFGFLSALPFAPRRISTGVIGTMPRAGS